MHTTTAELCQFQLESAWLSETHGSSAGSLTGPHFSASLSCGHTIYQLITHKVLLSLSWLKPRTARLQGHFANKHTHTSKGASPLLTNHCRYSDLKPSKVFHFFSRHRQQITSNLSLAVMSCLAHHHALKSGCNRLICPSQCVKVGARSWRLICWLACSTVWDGSCVGA